MPAYLINICRSISDRDAVEAYWRSASATYTGKARVLAAYTPFEILEGDIPVWGVVAVEWDSMEDARQWYHGPRYQSVKSLREGAQDNICLLVDGGWVPMEARRPPPDFPGAW